MRTQSTVVNKYTYILKYVYKLEEALVTVFSFSNIQYKYKTTNRNNGNFIILLCAYCNVLHIGLHNVGLMFLVDLNV